jgi:hypothetical protein
LKAFPSYEKSAHQNPDVAAGYCALSLHYRGGLCHELDAAIYYHDIVRERNLSDSQLGSMPPRTESKTYAKTASRAAAEEGASRVTIEFERLTHSCIDCSLSSSISPINKTRGDWIRNIFESHAAAGSEKR